MTDETQQPQTDFETKKFVFIFWFCVGMAAAGLILLTGLIFGTIPKENQQMANVALGFITGTLVTGVMQYLIGGNPTGTKKADTNVNTAGQVNVNAQPTDQPQS